VELIEAGNAIDANDDGVFCLKAVSNLRGNNGAHWAYFSHWAYFYWARDNDIAAVEK
jgi:hypothetical protein